MKQVWIVDDDEEMGHAISLMLKLLDDQNILMIPQVVQQVIAGATLERELRSRSEVVDGELVVASACVQQEFTADVVGHGLGKAKEVQEAIAKGIDDAKKNLVKVAVRKGTIQQTQEGKFAGAQVLLKPAAHGTGVIAGGAMRAVLESVGVTDVLAKSKGSSNPHNVVKATIDALVNLRDASSVARQRGVELERVFNG